MNLTHLTVTNFKGLREVDIPLSRFVCVIGQNNAGKSTLLQALLLFVEGRKLEPSMYFDPGLPITIKVKLEEVSDEDLFLITNEEHRKRFSSCLANKTMTLVRRYGSDGSSSLRWIARVTNEARFQPDSIDSLLEGKRPGATFLSDLTSVFPELAGRVDPKTNQKQAKQAIEELATSIPDADKVDREMELPAGIDNSIRPLLPEPIYIAAVKDLADEIATKDSASFGKILGILLNQIASQLERTEETFKKLKADLNRMPQPDGSSLDGRLEAVRNIETMMQNYVQENFPRVEIDVRIPPPEIKTILSSAEIWVNDGVLGLIDSKGDGLKRTITFSILRTYTDLRRTQKYSNGPSPAPTNYLFLFEEPELYLHPGAQRVLFDALDEISKTNHVVVSTHSPMFFSPEATKTFIKLSKKFDESICPKPFGDAVWVDLSSMDSKNKFQIISYETNNTAFFYGTVVLVEGDTELLVFPHIARMIDPSWGPEKTNTTFCRISGKGNIARYRDFFRAFGARVCVIGDLDCVIDGFDQLQPSRDCLDARTRLFETVDQFANATGVVGRVSSRDIRDIQESDVRRQRFNGLTEAITRYREGNATLEDVAAAENAFFIERVASKRRQVLEESNDPEIVGQKRNLLRLLRASDVFLLERGTIEEYYPAGITGPDKPSKALDFCARVQTKDDLLALCDEIEPVEGGPPDREFRVIFSAVFAEE